MNVHTQTPRLEKLRKGVMELYISDHPLDCLTCSANNDCELQDEAANVGLRDVRYGYEGDNHLALATDHSNPYFDFDPSKCIVCSRCVRACDEVQGTFALTIDGRGFASMVSAGQDEDNFLSSECVSCGACVQACPTATLREKSVKAIGLPERAVVTTCAYCGVGCTFRAEMRGEQLVRMIPWKDGKANRGHTCVKGRFAYGYANHKDRILTPDDPRKHRPAVARSQLGRSADATPPSKLNAIKAKHGAARARRHHLQPLHQRGDLPRAEAGARRVRHQQRRYLRPRVPLADRLRPQDHLRHQRRHAGFRLA